MAALSRAMRAAIVAAREPSRAAISAWRKGAEHRALSAALGSVDSAEHGAARAETLLRDGAWADALLDPLVEHLGRDPYFEPPFKVSRDPARTGAVLFESAAATLTASVTRAAALAGRPVPDAVVISGRVTVTRYIRAGGIRLSRWRAEPLTPAFSAATAAPCTPLPSIDPDDGEVHRSDGRSEGQVALDATGDIVTLVATIHAGAAALVREYSVPEGRLLRVASADDRASRTEMLLAFLRLSGRADAGERFDAATRDPAFHLRWAAMREWLALDARTAMPRLVELAESDPNLEVRAAAAKMLAPVRRRIAEAECRG